MASRDKRIDLLLYGSRHDKLVELCGGDPEEENPDTDMALSDKLRELIDEAHAQERHIEIFELASDVVRGKEEGQSEEDFMITGEKIRRKYGGDSHLIELGKIMPGQKEIMEEEEVK